MGFRRVATATRQYFRTCSHTKSNTRWRKSHHPFDKFDNFCAVSRHKTQAQNFFKYTTLSVVLQNRPILPFQLFLKSDVYVNMHQNISSSD